MKKKLVVFSGLVLGFAPVMALAQVTGGSARVCSTGTATVQIGTILCKISDLLNLVVPIILALGVVYFVWGVISYVVAGDEEAKTKGRDRMIYGIIGLAVIIALWGIVKILTNTFGIDTNPQNITLPTTPY